MLAASNDPVVFLIFVVIVLIVNAFRFLAQKLSSTQERPEPATTEGEWTAPEDQVRRFLQELRGGEAARPAEQAASRRKARRRKKKKPKADAGESTTHRLVQDVKPEVRIERVSWYKFNPGKLRKPAALRDAIVVREILGPPAAYKYLGGRLPRLPGR